MSDAASQADEIAQIVTAYASILTNTSVGVAVITLLSYEYLLLLSREVETFWKRRATGASVLFILNRYLPILSYIVQLVPVHRLSDQGYGESYSHEIAPRRADTYIYILSCSAIATLTGIITVLPYFPWAVFSTLRTFALSDKFKWPISTLVFFLSIVPVGINFSRFRWLISENDAMFGCLVEVPAPPELAKRVELPVTIASRTCLIASDLIVLGVTWAATYRTSKLVRDAVGGSRKRTFSDTLLRDGTLYFVVLLMLNILHLTFTELSINFEALVPASYATIFAEPLTAIIISRFLLNLQDANQPVAQGSDMEMSIAPGANDSLRFVQSRVIGPLGSSLSFNSSDYHDESENMETTLFEGVSTVGVPSDHSAEEEIIICSDGVEESASMSQWMGTYNSSVARAI